MQFNTNGFSLHAGVNCEGHQKEKRDRPDDVPLFRYISRPAVAVTRLSLSSTGKVVYTLKTPYSDGTTQVAFEGAAIREEFVGIELFVLSSEGERERSATPAIPVLTTGTARAVLRAVFRHFKFRDYSLGKQILSTPVLYFYTF